MTRGADMLVTNAGLEYKTGRGRLPRVVTETRPRERRGLSQQFLDPTPGNGLRTATAVELPLGGQVLDGEWLPHICS